VDCRVEIVARACARSVKRDSIEEDGVPFVVGAVLCVPGRVVGGVDFVILEGWRRG
jgi:hypothetical protein